MLTGWSGAEGHLVGYLYVQLVTNFALAVGAAFVLRARSPYLYVGAALTGAVLSAGLALATFGSTSAGPFLDAFVDVSLAGGRAVGPFGNPNYFGLSSAIALVATVGCLMLVRTRAKRAIIVTAAVILAVALVLSLSRGAMAAALAGLVALAFVRSWKLGVVIILIGLVAIVAIYPIFVDWRLGYTNGMPSRASYQIIAESDGSRLLGALAGWTLFQESPLFGVGWGHYSFLSGDAAGLSFGIAAHNWYVGILAELGLVGIGLWLAFLGSIAVRLVRRPSRPRIFGIGVLVTYAAGSMFLEPPASVQTSAMPILFVVAALVADWSTEWQGRPEPSEVIAGTVPAARRRTATRATG